MFRIRATKLEYYTFEVDTDSREEAILAILEEDPRAEQVDYAEGDWCHPRNWEVEDTPAEKEE